MFPQAVNLRPHRQFFSLLKNNPAMMTVFCACYVVMISNDCQSHLTFSQHDSMYIIVPLCSVSYVMIKTNI